MKPSEIAKVTQVDSTVLALLDEYYNEVDVLQRDTAEALRSALALPASGMWIALLGKEAVGCIILRPLVDLPRSGECKRLYVQPQARQRGIADALLTELERYAQAEGLDWIYLDSKDDLLGALSLYRRRSYLPCPRYNANPQATVFLRKSLRSPQPVLLEERLGDGAH